MTARAINRWGAKSVRRTLRRRWLWRWRRRVAATSRSAADAGLPPVKAIAKPAHSDTLTLVLVGDVGLNRSGTAVDPRGVLEGPQPTPWSDLR